VGQGSPFAGAIKGSGRFTPVLALLDASLARLSSLAFITHALIPLSWWSQALAFSHQFTPPNAGEARHCKKRSQFRHLFFCRL
jgi:hypothetical protein